MTFKLLFKFSINSQIISQLWKSFSQLICVTISIIKSFFKSKNHRPENYPELISNFPELIHELNGLYLFI